MQPRGQLWFELQRVCQDFRDFSGLEPKDCLLIMLPVLRNLLADTETEYEKLVAAGTAPADASPSPETS